jgi:hypothetical protein
MPDCGGLPGSTGQAALKAERRVEWWKRDAEEYAPHDARQDWRPREEAECARREPLRERAQAKLAEHRLVRPQLDPVECPDVGFAQALDRLERGDRQRRRS